jgi:hypothetical protein
MELGDDSQNEKLLSNVENNVCVSEELCEVNQVRNM